MKYAEIFKEIENENNISIIDRVKEKFDERNNKKSRRRLTKEKKVEHKFDKNVYEFLKNDVYNYMKEIKYFDGLGIDINESTFWHRFLGRSYNYSYKKYKKSNTYKYIKFILSIKEIGLRYEDNKIHLLIDNDKHAIKITNYGDIIQLFYQLKQLSNFDLIDNLCEDIHNQAIVNINYYKDKFLNYKLLKDLTDIYYNDDIILIKEKSTLSNLEDDKQKTKFLKRYVYYNKNQNIFNLRNNIFLDFLSQFMLCKKSNTQLESISSIVSNTNSNTNISDEYSKHIEYILNYLHEFKMIDNIEEFNEVYDKGIEILKHKNQINNLNKIYDTLKTIYDILIKNKSIYNENIQLIFENCEKMKTFLANIINEYEENNQVHIKAELNARNEIWKDYI